MKKKTKKTRRRQRGCIYSHLFSVMLLSVCFRRRKEHSHLTCLRGQRRQIWSSPPHPQHKTCSLAVKTVRAFSPVRVGFPVHWGEALAAAHLWVRAPLHTWKGISYIQRDLLEFQNVRSHRLSKYQKSPSCEVSLLFLCSCVFHHSQLTVPTVCAQIFCPA